MQTDLRLKFFQLAWAASFLAHFDQRLEWFNTPLNLLCSIASLLFILWSDRIYLFSLAIGLQILVVWNQMPIVDNHWFLSAFLNLLFLYTCAKKTAWKDLIPCIQILIGLMYFFAAFHKWNTGFLDSSQSCAIELYDRIRSYPWLPDLPALTSETLKNIQIYGILILESSLPLLFLWRRMWFWALCVGIFFHLLTGLFLRHYPSTLFALYWLMIPRDVLENAFKNLKVPSLLRNFKVYLLGSSALFIATFIWLKASGASDPHGVDSPRWLALRIWSLSTVALSIWLIIKLLPFRRKAHEPVKISKGLGFVVALFVFNGFSPYLGLKTTTSFSMWSNLEIHEQGSNHLLFSGTGLRLFPYADEFFRIEMTNLQVLKNSSDLYSICELKRIVETTESLNPDKILELQVASDRGIYLLEDLKHRSDWKRLNWWPLHKLIAIHSLHPQIKACEW